jgi:hypothetical protein
MLVRVPTPDLVDRPGDVIHVVLIAEQDVLGQPHCLVLTHALRDRAVARGRDVVQEAAQPLQATQQRRGLVDDRRAPSTKLLDPRGSQIQVRRLNRRQKQAGIISLLSFAYHDYITPWPKGMPGGESGTTTQEEN